MRMRKKRLDAELVFRFYFIAGVPENCQEFWNKRWSNLQVCLKKLCGMLGALNFYARTFAPFHKGDSQCTRSDPVLPLRHLKPTAWCEMVTLFFGEALFTQDAEADLRTNLGANPLMLLPGFGNTPIYCSVFSHLHGRVARCSTSRVNRPSGIRA